VLDRDAVTVEHRGVPNIEEILAETA
jgi:hypothetical protein